MKKVYIVLLNYKGIKDTLECLESLLKLDYPNFQIFVVDNTEAQHDQDLFADWAQGKPVQIDTAFENLVYPLAVKPVDHTITSQHEFLAGSFNQKIVFVKSDRNGGFSAGNNIALRHILKFGDKDSFIWLLNNDTVAKKESLSELTAFAGMEENKNTGIIGCRLVYYYTPDKIQAVGGRFNETFFISEHEGEGQPVTTAKSNFRRIDYVIGASMFVPYTFLHDVGLLSEDYFLYYEELDWTYRARKKGWSIDWCPEAIVYHKEGASIGSSYREKKSLFSEEQLFKSRRIFIKKFYTLSGKFYLSGLLLMANRIRKGNFKAAAAVAKTMYK
ncbi:glycosyltransferase family 2 protein [Flavobacterium suzhouense]|uniref:Glycosyltransferase family 2 protein n=1 Tax=Flavobacterium suzhouense TaxID=1529638 RepID=A0ABW5NTD4_9FLAO